MTDAGMTGDYDSIIGMQKEEPLRRFTSGIPSGRFEPAVGAATLSGVAVETDDATGLALKIAPVRIGGRLAPASPEFWAANPISPGRVAAPDGAVTPAEGQDSRKPMRKAPQWRPRTRIGEDRSFISTKLPPPMSRR